MLRLTAIFLFVSILATTPAAAQGASGDGLVYGYGLLCDTPEQVARYLAIASGGGDVGSAARAVNLEAGKDDACVLGASGFLVGSEVG